MNKFSLFNILFSLLIASTSITAQHKDCSTALELCGNSPFHLVPSSGIGISDPDVTNTCIGQEFNSMWVKWTVKEDGIISFILTPDSSWQDLDFVVYQPGNENDCNDKTAIRCMATGANTGQPPQQWLNCVGPTGLATGNTDFEEPPGCPAGSNNFLAPIEALAGDQYIMLINEFSQSGYGYTLTFTGTAELNCITGTADSELTNPPATFVVYPTISTGSITIHIAGDRPTDNHLNVFNAEGQVVYSNEKVGGMDSQVDLHYLPTGVYIAALRTSHSMQTQKFIITQ